MSIRYRIPEGLCFTMVQNQPTICYPGGGKVVVDERVARIWGDAHDKTLEEILTGLKSSNGKKDETRAVLACLSEADLLARDAPQSASLSSAEDPRSGSLVSVVMVAYEGVQWLKECIPAILHQTYRPIEIIIIDNASPSREMERWIKEFFPQVLLKRLDKPHSFASANNIGIQESKGEYIILMNQDVKLEPDVVARLVKISDGDPYCAAVAAKLRFWWAPKFLNGLGNVVRKHSWGTDLGFGNLDLGQFDNFLTIPSACFATALIPRRVWEDVGEIDEGFPMYYEDSEWCYRARLLGYRIKAAPDAVAYHAFGGKISSGEQGGLSSTKLRNVCYGRLRFAKKLTCNPLYREIVWNYFKEDWRNFLASILKGKFSHSIAYVQAYVQFLKTGRNIKREHGNLTGRMKVSENVLFEFPFEIPPSIERNGLPLLDWETIISYYLPLIETGKTKTMPEFASPNRRPNLLIVSNDIVGAIMAGPGMRYLEMARALSQDVDITLAVPSPTTLEIPGVRIISYNEDQPDTLEVLVQNHQQVLISGYMVIKFRFLENTRSRIIVDFYDPFFLENYYYYRHDPLESQMEHNRVAIDVVNRLSRIGDFFICGNERQRDLWLGILAANGRINPQTVKQDETLRKLINVVGIGFPERTPKSEPNLRFKHPAFHTDTKVVLWGGGIWNWLDPISLVKAWPEVVNKHPEARLVFLGTRHPNPKVPQHEVVDRLVNEAKTIGEDGKTIFFIEWLPYEEREAFLCESHIGVTFHPIHAETRYSIRTRVLDYFWARLPVLITEGDITSEWVKEYKVGYVIPPGDSQAISTALNEMLSKDKTEWNSSYELLHKSMAWPKVIGPLADFLRNGRAAPDRERINQAQYFSIPDSEISIRNPFKKAMYLWATKGLTAMIRQILIHIRFLLSRK